MRSPARFHYRIGLLASFGEAANSHLAKQRAAWPILLGDAYLGSLDRTAYPDEATLRFTITLNLPPSTWLFEPV